MILSSVHPSLFSAEVRLQYFTVYVADTQPPIVSGNDLKLSEFTYCGMYPGTPPGGKFVSVRCPEGTAGSYVYITVHKTTPLNLCEVEVYGKRKSQGYGTY